MPATAKHPQGNMRTGIATLFNRSNDGAFATPKDGWYQIVPKGEFPHNDSGKLQVLDADALKSIVNRFNDEAKSENFPGILVDFDHFSTDPGKPSEAAGWIEQVENRTDGVWGKIRWSDVGLAAVSGGRYRLTSPVWNRKDCETLSGDRIRPMRLDSLALTNDPNMKGSVPLSNRDKVKNASGELAKDGSFVDGFDGCVMHMEGMGHDMELAKKICGHIAEHVKNAMAGADYKNMMDEGASGDGEGDDSQLVNSIPSGQRIPLANKSVKEAKAQLAEHGYMPHSSETIGAGHGQETHHMLKHKDGSKAKIVANGDKALYVLGVEGPKMSLNRINNRTQSSFASNVASMKADRTCNPEDHVAAAVKHTEAAACYLDFTQLHATHMNRAREHGIKAGELRKEQTK